MGSELVGRQVTKQFQVVTQVQTFAGNVVSFNPALWTIRYDDGEYEKVEALQLRRCW
jgi:hypothetical protein